ncbi:hypothetical protein OG949_31965 [Streptomyces scopuliridis]|uniref:phage tail protein n=1 Tax=Streptomyces scopuliridis TaxID=452529 RepID=UPI002DDB9007|nr:hypothetical protein [Streptomyces scopuliridis]WSB37003.1 hypothetical protein OG949_31965 [Streptomyces scopuliridis]
MVKPPPSQAPGFRKVQQDVAAKKQRIKQHKPAASESRSAQDAAVAPPDDKQAQGKAANAEKMNEAKPGEFDKNAFVGAVNEAIAAQAPKNLDEADGFADSGKADTIKDSVDGKVKDGKKSSAEDIESTTTAAPDTSQAKEKQVTPMGPDQPPGNPGAPSAADAVPDRQPDKVLDFSEGNQQADQQMADAEVTEEQLAKGNEPQFDTALSEKEKGEQHTASAPAKGRAAEAKQLSAAKAGAAASGAAAMSAMTAERAAAGKAVDGGKGETKSADEKKREQVTAKLQKVFDATQKDVEKILGDLDGKVDKQFTEGERRARDDFTADHKRRMKQYKDRRYSGFTGKGRWLRDKFKGLPQEGLDIFKKSRELYVTKMQSVISSIADTIGTELGRAKARIATGRNELKAEVDKLPADLKQFGEEAAADFAGKFDDLESEVNDKSTQLVQDLAQKYTEALNSVDEEIKKLEEENKGLIAKVVDAVVGVIQTINELKNLLLGILAKAAGAVMKILKDPIGFLRNLVSAVGAGLNLFIGNIATHLQKGLVSWLLGTAVSTGLEIPSRFDLKGIIQLIASLLGLTWDNIRARVTRKGVPDEAMTKAEQSVPVAQALAREGPAGAAQEITAETGDLKSTILDDLKSYLIPTVLMAGITWILSLLNPASAFIRAVKGIIDIVTFIVTQGAQIVEFVNSVLDAVVAIANGAAAAVPKTVETALAASIPLLIGLLASLLGIGGLANRVRQAFEKVSRPVNRAIDKIVDKIAKAAKRFRNKPKGTDKRVGGEKGHKEGVRGGSQEGNKRDPRLGKKINDDLQMTLGSSMEAASIKPAVNAVYRRWRGKGLRSLEIEPTKGSPGHFSVFSTYNPIHHYEVKVKAQEPVFTVPESVLTSAEMKFKDKIIRFTHETFAVATLKSVKKWGFPETSSENGRHAEQRIIEHVVNNRNKFLPKKKVQSGEPGGASNGRAEFVLKVTRSPCPEICAPLIGGLRDQVREQGWNIHTTVLAMGLYKPFGSGDEDAPKYPKLSSGESSSGEPVGRAGLQILKDWEVDHVGVLRIDDPAIQSGFSQLSEQEQRDLAALITRWNRSLARNINRIWPTIPGKIGGP